MATISVTIPDVDIPRCLNAACVALFYQDTINGSPNPETKANFIRRKVAETIKGWVIAGEVTPAAEAAKATAFASANALSIT